MKTLTVVLMALAFSATDARAQVFTVAPPFPQSSAFGSDPVMRVNAILRSTIESQAVADVQAQATARRALYEMAQNECAALSEVFKAECRVAALTVNLPAPPGSAQLSTSLTANVSYELKLKAR